MDKLPINLDSVSAKAIERNKAAAEFHKASKKFANRPSAINFLDMSNAAQILQEAQAELDSEIEACGTAVGMILEVDWPAKYR